MTSKVNDLNAGVQIIKNQARGAGFKRGTQNIVDVAGILAGLGVNTKSTQEY